MGHVGYGDIENIAVFRFFNKYGVVEILCELTVDGDMACIPQVYPALQHDIDARLPRFRLRVLSESRGEALLVRDELADLFRVVQGRETP